MLERSSVIVYATGPIDSPRHRVWPSDTWQTRCALLVSCGFSVVSCSAVRPTDAATLEQVSAQLPVCAGQGT